MAMIKHVGLVQVKTALLSRLSFIVERMNKDYSYQELADMLSCSVGTVGNIKSGRRYISLNMLLNIADRLKLTYQLVINGKNGKTHIECTVESSYDYMGRANKFVKRKAKKILNQPNIH